MKKSVEIFNELKEISPLLASMDRVNVFTVPQGYFESIAVTVVAGTGDKNEQIEGTKTGDLPAGYFDNLSTEILAKIKHRNLNELQEISPLLAGIKKSNPFVIPEKYFEQTTSDIAAKLDKEMIPAVLQGVKSLPTYTVPDGYFDNLPSSILNKIEEKPAAKIISMPVRRNFILKYASAAILTGAMALGVYKFTNNPSILPSKIITATVVLEPGIELGKNMDEKKFNETLDNLSEEDIAKYLEKNGTESDIAELSKDVDQSSLPSEEDYLTDDKTLDKFLETISSKN